MAIRVSNVTAQVLLTPTGIAKSVSDVISFYQEAERRAIRVSNFTIQILQLEAGVFGNASSAISFSDVALNFLAIDDRKPIFDTLTFTDSVTSPNWPQLEDEIVFTQQARSSIWNLNLRDILGLHDTVPGYCWGAPWTPIEIEDDLGLTQWASAIPPQTLSDTISFVQIVEWTKINEVQFIDFEQEVEVGLGHGASSTITFTHGISTACDFLRTVAHANFIRHAMTYYIDNGCNRKSYARFVGDGVAEGLDEQRLTWDANMALESLSGDLLVLRNPETDDHDRLGFGRINRESRGGELNVYGDPAWAKVNTLLFTIVALSDGKTCPDVINDTLDFFQTYLGQEIYLHDWTGTSWRGVVTTPNDKVVEDSEGYWTLTFEFEGVEEPGSVPQSSMTFSHSLDFTAIWARSLSHDLGLTDVGHAGGDIYLTASNTLVLEQEVSGIQEITVLYDDLAGGSAVDLHGTSPTTGTSTWSAHQEYQDDGTMANPANAGAYYPISPVSDTVYELTIQAAAVASYEDGYACIWGFFEGVTPSDLLQGPTVNGNLNPTCAKAVHLMREVAGGTRNNAYRRGSESDGAADTIQWTDATLRASPDAVLDLRIVLDTTGDTWTATWYAKSVISGTYTQVGPETNLLSDNIGAVGFACDSLLVELSTDYITLLELRPI